MSMERFYAIVYPLKSRSVCTVSQARSGYFKNIIFLYYRKVFVLQEGGGRGLVPLLLPRPAPKLDPGLTLSIQQSI